ncbi:hypothetical protein DPMN_135221 [Dreissena polymorpha]|uniref:Uncharacterized protein n=1 Tax=Dreissena polymorpha TaxID=45954 RepID=A0A9D4G1F0_DREPO|nr:hypothetical protein DPMN_135221 [Dreissena polymorpha]
MENTTRRGPYGKRPLEHDHADTSSKVSKMFVNVDDVAPREVVSDNDLPREVVSDNDLIGIGAYNEEDCITLPTTSMSPWSALQDEHDVNHVPTDDLCVSFNITLYHVQ